MATTSHGVYVSRIRILYEERYLVYTRTGQQKKIPTKKIPIRAHTFSISGIIFVETTRTRDIVVRLCFVVSYRIAQNSTEQQQWRAELGGTIPAPAAAARASCERSCERVWPKKEVRFGPCCAAVPVVRSFTWSEFDVDFALLWCCTTRINILCASSVVGSKRRSGRGNHSTTSTHTAAHTILYNNGSY